MKTLLVYGERERGTTDKTVTPGGVRDPCFRREPKGLYQHRQELD